MAAAVVISVCGSWIGCAVSERSTTTMSAAGQPTTQPSQVAAAPTGQKSILYSWRARIRREPWPRLDQWYARFATAIPREEPSAYRAFLKQTAERDANLRANGYIGITAADPEAAAGRLAKLIGREKDSYNRTIIVWCLRFAGSGRAAIVLSDFLGAAKDADYGLCLDTRGRIAQFRAPFPLASAEAFKALYVMKGAAYMLEGPGWAHVLNRLERNVDPEPLRVDWQRLRSDPAQHETDRQTAERMMRELDDK